MIQVDKINTAFFSDSESHLIGYRQDLDPEFDIVDANNITSTSGEFFQDFSPLVTIPNIHQNQQYAAISDDDFNTLLRTLSKAATIKVLREVFSDMDYVENKILYPFENIWTNTIDNTTSFVGYEINIAKRKDFLTTLNQVFTSFNGVDTVKLLVFHSSKDALIHSQEVTTVENSDVATVVDWDFSPTEFAGGKFYIGYLRSGLTSKAINREWDSSNIRNCYKTLGIRPIIIDGWDQETLFDVDDIEYEDETYGLNFDITTWKDYTNVIIQNKNKFVKAIGLQLAVDVLDLILKSTRSNKNERQMSTNVLLERDGIIDASKDATRVDAIIPRLRREIKSLKATFTEQPFISKGTL